MALGEDVLGRCRRILDVTSNAAPDIPAAVDAARRRLTVHTPIPARVVRVLQFGAIALDAMVGSALCPASGGPPMLGSPSPVRRDRRHPVKPTND
jgi:hypothetical protein